MSKTTKATLWILGVFAALSLAVYFAGCGDDTTEDAGTTTDPCAASTAKEGDTCTGGVCRVKTGNTFECVADCSTIGTDCTQTDKTAGTCYLLEKGVTGCLPTGTVETGAACTTASACVAGDVCSTECYKLCDTATPCTDTGATCTEETDLGVSLCEAEAT